MNELTSDILLEKYETLLLIIEDLQSKITKLTKFYEQVREKYNLYNEEVEEALSEMRSTKDKVVDDIKMVVTTSKKDLSVAATEIRNLLTDLALASVDAKSIIEQANKFELSFPKFEERLSILEIQMKKMLVGANDYIPFDYEEVLSGAQIYEKYNGKTNKPIIVKMPSWNGDYCMVITHFDKESNVLTGRMYKDGDLYAANDYPKGIRKFLGHREFRVYKSPNEGMILKNEQFIILTSV